MIRHFAAIILLVTVLSGLLHAGGGQSGPGDFPPAGCSVFAGDGSDAPPCHNDNDGSCRDGHCCGAHLHLTLIGSPQGFYGPAPERLFSSRLAHFNPSDHTQDRFIPPRLSA